MMNDKVSSAEIYKDVNERRRMYFSGKDGRIFSGWSKSRSILGDSSRAYYISIVGNPAISVPCAFSKGGLPIGIQIIGRHNADLSVLQMGYAFEQLTKIGSQRPAIAE